MPGKMSAVRWLELLRSSPRRAWLVTFLLVTTVATSWSLAAPPYGSIDEINHVIKAVSVARGDWTATKVPDDEAPENELFLSGWGSFDIPEVYGDAAVSAGCYRGQPAETPDCLSFSGDSHDAQVLEPDSRYPPGYYLVVGLAERLWHPGASAIWLMRLVTTLISAALVASAVVSLLRLRAPRFALLGVAAAATPMAFHLAGSVNPNGPEIAAAIALWSCGAVLVREVTTTGLVDRRLVLRIAVAASVLSLARPLSPLFAGAIVAALVALLPWTAIRALLRSRVAWVGAAAVGVVMALQLAWVVAVRPNYFGKPLGPEVSDWDIIGVVVGKAPGLYRQMIGVFGAPDVNAPEPAIILWTLVLGGVAFAALAIGRRRWVAIAGVVTVAAVVIPMAGDLMQARALSYPWQGRYTIPIAVGVPLLLGLAVSVGDHPRLLRRPLLLGSIGVAIGLAQFMSFLAMLRRYTVGTDETPFFWFGSGWTPPLPSIVLTVSALVGLTGWLVWLLAPGPDVDPTDAEEPADLRARQPEAAPRPDPQPVL